MKLDNVYWSWDASTAEGGNPSILAIGDSWFWYPLPGGSLIEQPGNPASRKSPGKNGCRC